MSSMTPKRKEMPSGGGGGGDYVPFETPLPKKGLRQVAVSFLVSFGVHKNDPYEATDDDGVKQLNDDGSVKIIVPKPIEQMGVYVDMLNDEWDYGDVIGVQQIRMPIHNEFLGRIEKDGGINFNETGHGKTKAGEWIKLPWTLPDNSRWNKIAEACGQEVIMEAGTYEKENPFRSDITLLLGQPFMMNCVIKKKPGKKMIDGVETDIEYTNVNLKQYVPLVEGIPAGSLKTEPLALNFYSEVDDIVKNIKYFRPAVVRKIMTALDYSNINFDDESQPVIPSNMKLAFDQVGMTDRGSVGKEGAQEASKTAQDESKAPTDAKPKAKSKASARAVQQPVDVPDDFDNDVPF